MEVTCILYGLTGLAFTNVYSCGSCTTYLALHVIIQWPWQNASCWKIL